MNRLSDAITDEAEALASANADALMDAVERKQAAAEALADLDEDAIAGLDKLQVASLREANLSNAALMQVAQGHVLWALDKMGRLESPGTYARDGAPPVETRSQYLGSV